jgi:hypothetical protein
MQWDRRFTKPIGRSRAEDVNVCSRTDIKGKLKINDQIAELFDR